MLENSRPEASPKGLLPTVEPKAWESARPAGNGHHVQTFAVLVILLIQPLCAFLSLPAALGLRWIFAYGLLISAATYGIYWHDKKRARQEGWRVKESTLHFLELLGGWPGAFLAQQILRHKTSKLGYQTVFWTIILLYQYVALDFVLEWKLSKQALIWIKGVITLP